MVHLVPNDDDRKQTVVSSFAFKTKFQNKKSKQKYEGSSKPSVRPAEENLNEKPKDQSNEKEKKKR